MKPKLLIPHSRLAAQARVLGLSLLAGAGLAAQADTIFLNSNMPLGTGWNDAYWGGPPGSVPYATNEYIIPASLSARTPGNTTPAAFLGASLEIRAAGTLSLKHGNNPALVNLILAGGSLTQSQGPGGTTNCPMSGTINVISNSTIAAGTGAGPRHILITSTLSGTGNLTVNMLTNVLYLAGNASGYSGNWTVTGGRMEVWSGTANPFGSGSVTLNDLTNTLTFNSATEIPVPNLISGFGSVIKLGSGQVTLSGANTFYGALTIRDGTLVLAGPDFGNQSATTVNNNGVLRLADGNRLGYTPLTVDGNNAMTARLELSNNVTVQTYQAIPVSMRNNASVAIQSISGNNVIADPISINSGGGQLYLQADAGTSLELSGGVACGTSATGGRNFTLQGAGIGLASGIIGNGSATALTLNKSGTGTWTLNAANSYTGNTVVNAGVLKLGAAGSIGSSPIIQIETNGTLDVSSAGGLTLGGGGTPQTLRGRGAVLGDLASSAGSGIEVAFVGQTGSLNLSNSLTLGGDDVLRFDIATGSNDVLNVSGNLVLNGNTTNLVNIIGGFVDNGTYRLINYGGTLQGGGYFTLVTPTSRQSFSLDLSTPHQVNLVVTGNPTSLVWSGDNVLNYWDVGTSLNWNAGTEVFYSADYVTFNDSGSATPDVDVLVPVLVSGMVVSNETKNFTFIDTNGISTSGSLTKQGAGLVAFANAGNAMNGPITIAAGTLQIGNGDTNGSLGNGPISNQSALVMNKSTNNGATLGGAITGPGTITVKSGSLLLTGTNTYTGTTTVETGDISLRNNLALGDPAVGTVVLSGGSLRVPSLGTWVIPEPVSVVGEGYTGFPGALYANTLSNNVTWAGPITLTGPTRFRAVNNYVQMAFANTVQGDQTPLRVTSEGTGTRVTFRDTLNLGDTAALAKDGSGALVLAGATNVAASTTVDTGMLQILTTNSPQIGDVTMTTGTLQIGDGGFTGSFPSGVVNLVAAASTLSITSSNTLTLDQQVIGAGKLGKLGYGKLIIAASNTFAGTVTTGSGTPTTGGTILLRNSAGFGDEFAAKNVSIVRTEVQLENNLTIPAGITWQISGSAAVTDVGVRLIPIRSLSGNNVINGNVSMIGGAGDSEMAVDTGSLTVNGNLTADTTSLRTMRLSGAGVGIINGTINNGTTTSAVLKYGSGAWTLNNLNSYTGATTIQEGTLALGPAASIANTPTIELKSNAVFNVSAAGDFPLWNNQTLKGNGTVTGNVIAQGTVSPGASVGALYVTGSIQLGGTNVMELSRTNAPLNADLLSAASIAFGGELIVTNIGPALQGGEVFNLFDGTLSAAFVAITLPTLSSPLLSWNTTELATLGIIKVDGGQAPPFSLGAPTLVGTNLVVQFNSEAGYNYYLEATPSLTPTSWSTLSTNAGGGVITLEIPVDAATPQRFFRVRAGLQ
jgi:fibronectin-binding autotransporter adhesin